MRKFFEKEEGDLTKGSLPVNIQLFAHGDDVDSDDEIDEEVDPENNPDDGKNKDDDQTNDSGKADGKSGGAKSNKTFTQEQVARMMTREKNQGRNAALKELGIDPKDTKTLKMIQAFVSSQKSDDKEDAEGSETQQKIQEATDRALKAECKAEALALGAKKEFVDDVVVLVMAKYEEDADLNTLIGEIKTKYKNFFEGEAEDDKATGKKGTGSALKKGKGDKGNEEKSLGSRLAAQRVGTAKKTSSFMKRN